MSEKYTTDIQFIYYTNRTYLFGSIIVYGSLLFLSSFNCVITEKCMFFYNDPSTLSWHDFVSLDYTADVKDHSQPSENSIWNTIFIYLVGNELVLGSYFINLENVFISTILLPLILIRRVWRYQWGNQKP